MDVVLIFGALGQDGTYLAERLIGLKHIVYGVIKEDSQIPLKYNFPKMNYIRGNIQDSAFILEILMKIKPTKIFNLASASSVAESINYPEVSKAVNFEFVKLLSCSIIKFREITGLNPKLIHASSSEMFGPDQTLPISEISQFNPKSPYAIHKAESHKLLKSLTNKEGLNVSIAILFNHESERRPLKFVSRKITHSAFLISQGKLDKITIGNPKIKRDWGYAPDFVLALQYLSDSKYPDEFIVATGILHTIEDMCKLALATFNINEYQNFIKSDSRLIRKVDNSGLIGNYDKIRAKLGWSPQTSFNAMIKIMTEAESNYLT